jgi:2'-phosphotransferase
MRKRGGRGGGEDGGSSGRLTRMSKTLSWALRHGAVELGLPISADGYVPLETLLALRQFKDISASDVDEIVSRPG